MLRVTVTDDFGVQAHLHRVHAQGLDRLVQHDLARSTLPPSALTASATSRPETEP